MCLMQVRGSLVHIYLTDYTIFFKQILILEYKTVFLLRTVKDRHPDLLSSGRNGWIVWKEKKGFSDKGMVLNSDKHCSESWFYLLKL